MRVWNEYIRRYKRSLTQKIRGTLISLMHATLVLSWYCFPKTNSLFSTLSKHHVLTFFSQISCCKMWCENVSTWFSGILCQLIYHIASCPWVISAMEIPFTLYALSESSLVLIPIGIKLSDNCTIRYISCCTLHSTNSGHLPSSVRIWGSTIPWWLSYYLSWISINSHS